VLTTNQKGAIAESAIVHAAFKLGVEVYRPLGEGGRYDLIFGIQDRLLRVQCKSAVRRDNVVVVPCYSARRSRDGFVRRAYTGDEVDVIAAYCAELDRSFLLPLEVFEHRFAVWLRLTPTRNNQRRGVNWANEFEFAAKLMQLGAIAQLGERLAGSQKVGGSSPPGSIP
jgi:PD-(D/E)XK nuclease superfamily protein